MRSDKAKNTAKVLKKVLEDPLANEREIAKDTGVSKSSVNRAKKELGQNGSITKSAPIVEICQKDLEISKLAQEITLNMLKDPKQEKTLRDVVYAGKESSARYAIFKGEATDKDGGLKIPDLSKVSDNELMEYLKKGLE